MTRGALIVVAALLAFVAAALSPSFVSAQGLSVTDGGVENRFPDGMEFSMSAQADGEIESVRLRYTILPDGTAASGVPDFELGDSVSTSFTLAGSDPPQIYLPPGTRVRYHWEVVDAAGETATTEEREIVYEDVRFEWRTAEAEGVTVHYYSGSDSDAEAMLEVARESLAETGALLGASVEFPVNVRIYASTDDMRDALQRRSESYESQIITAGVRVSSDTVLVLGNVSFSTLRHELAHVVTAIAGEGPFTSLPAWLDEGTAVYAQNDPEGFGAAVESAISRGNVLSLRSITSYPGDPSKVNLFYGQSWSVVSYLVDTYGEGKFTQLFAEIRSGKTTDDALEAVYGFDQGGLDNEWRESHGLPPHETPVDDGGDEGNGQSQAEVGSEDGGLSVGEIIALAVGVIVLAGTIGLGTILLARRVG